MLSIVIQLYILSEPKIKQCGTLIIHTALNMWHDPIDVSEIFLVHLTPFAEVGWLWLTLVAVILGFPTWCHCRLRGLELGSRWCYGVLKMPDCCMNLRCCHFLLCTAKKQKLLRTWQHWLIYVDVQRTKQSMHTVALAFRERSCLR